MRAVAWLTSVGLHHSLACRDEADNFIFLQLLHDTRELGGIRAPVQLLWGDHDALFPRAQQEAFLAALPTARIRVYEETGHCPNWERPEWVAADIADFVAGAARG